MRMELLRVAASPLTLLVRDVLDSCHLVGWHVVNAHGDFGGVAYDSLNALHGSPTKNYIREHTNE